MSLRIALVAGGSVIGLALLPLVGGLPEAHADFVLWQLRVPRVLMAALIGATLSTIGAAFQVVLQNPLATPSTVGTTAGATLGAVAAIVLGQSGSAIGPGAISIAAFVGALVVTLPLARLASSARWSVDDVLLAGIGITLATAAVATGVRYLSAANSTFAAAQWSLGHLPQVGYDSIVRLAPIAVLVVAVLLRQARALETMTGGDDRAQSQGVDAPRVRTLCLGAGALGVGASVALCGPIAFVGLIVPHLVRMAASASPTVVLPLSAIVGAAFLGVCDAGARLLVPGREVPVGVLTAALGAPSMLWLIARQRARSVR